MGGLESLADFLVEDYELGRRIWTSGKRLAVLPYALLGAGLHETHRRLARSFRNQGKRGMNYGSLHHDFGNSSRITEINALPGLMQLRKLPHVLQQRQAAYRIITKALDEAGLAYVSTRHMDAASQYKLIVPLAAGRRVEEVKTTLARDGVLLGGAVYDLPCHRQPVFQGICPGETYPGADRWCPRHICPPLTTAMTEEEAEVVGASLSTCLSYAPA